MVANQKKSQAWDLLTGIQCHLPVPRITRAIKGASTVPRLD